MADGIFPSIISRTRDANTASNVIFIQIADNAGNVAAVTGGALDVNASVVIDTSFVDDSAFVVATDKVMAIGLLADETAPDSVNEGDIGIPRMTLDRKQLHVLVDATTDSQRLGIDSGGRVTSKISDGTDTLLVNTDGSINVMIVTSTITGEVHDYNTASAIAADATSNHDYTVVNTTFLLKSVVISGSGNIKAEIQTGPLASLVTKAVVFLNGRQGDMKQVFFDPAIEVPVTSTGTVRVIRTNRQGAATDLYSTIQGIDQ